MFTPAAIAAPAGAATTPPTEDAFALKNGDRVCFYGDSLTDQRMYSALVESYVATRFPDRDVFFVHSGWGGDKVTGGSGGTLDQRLERDVLAYTPTVVTVLLGMNDAGYKGPDEALFQTYVRGYRRLVGRLKEALPGVRLTLLEPTAYDQYTRPGGVPDYNTLLVRYGAHVRELAAKEGALSVDVNAPLVSLLQSAAAADPALAGGIIRDRIHPGWGGHLVIAATLLRAWNAPALVSSVGLDYRAGRASGTERAVLGSVKRRESDGALVWTCTEEALPFPLLGYTSDPAFAFALKATEFVETLDRQMLTVSDLPEGSYTLKIDGEAVADFSAADLAKGVNLAPYATPMHQQAQAVDELTRRRTLLHHLRWRLVQTPVAPALADPTIAAEFAGERKRLAEASEKLAREIDARVVKVAAERRKAARPKKRAFQLIPVGAAGKVAAAAKPAPAPKPVPAPVKPAVAKPAPVVIKAAPPKPAPDRPTAAAMKPEGKRPAAPKGKV